MRLRFIRQRVDDMGRFHDVKRKGEEWDITKRNVYEGEVIQENRHLVWIDNGRYPMCFRKGDPEYRVEVVQDD